MSSARKLTSKPTTMVVGAAVFFAAAVYGADENFLTRRTLIPDQPVQSVIPKREEKRPEIKERSINSLSPDSALGGMADLPLMMQRPNVRIPLSRLQREELDRRKDWIFVTPDNKAFSAEKMLGVREDKNTLKGEEKEFKGVMQSFLERGDKKEKEDGEKDKEDTAKTNSSSEVSSRSDRVDRYEPLSSSNGRLGSRSSGLDGSRSGQDGDAQKRSSLLEPGSAASLFRPPGDALGGSGLYSDSTGFGGLPSPTARIEKTETQKAWDKEFKQLLDNRPSTPSPANPFGVGGDPVNSFSDTTRLPMNPVIGSSLSRSPFEPVSKSHSPFDGPGKLGAFGDTAPQIFGTSSLSPALLAPGLPSMNSAPKPGVLELPKRRF